MNTLKKLKTYRLFSALTIVIGVLFLLFGIFIEDDPNLVAPIFITGGALWYFMIRTRIRSQQT